jgi:siroheme synthase-like protein
MAAVDLTGRRCLVVGGGALALEKIEGLLACDARVRVVATEATDGVRELADSGAIEWERRQYRSADLDDSFLVIAATSDMGLNEAVHRDAEARSMLVNVVDVTHLCNFIAPAVVRLGPVAIAISTAGASPALAVRMKNEIAASFGPEYGRLALILNELRDWAKATLPTFEDRKSFFDAIVYGRPDPIDLLRAGREGELRELIAQAQEDAEA